MLTTEQAAKIIGVSPQMVARYVREGRLVAGEFGRSLMFDEKVVRRFKRPLMGRPAKARVKS